MNYSSDFQYLLLGTGRQSGGRRRPSRRRQVVARVRPARRNGGHQRQSQREGRQHGALDVQTCSLLDYNWFICHVL